MQHLEQSELHITTEQPPGAAAAHPARPEWKRPESATGLSISRARPAARRSRSGNGPSREDAQPDRVAEPAGRPHPQIRSCQDEATGLPATRLRTSTRSAPRALSCTPSIPKRRGNFRLPGHLKPRRPRQSAFRSQRPIDLVGYEPVDVVGNEVAVRSEAVLGPTLTQRRLSIWTPAQGD